MLEEIAVILLLSGLIAAHAAAAPEISFGANGKFKLVVFADLHYGEAAWAKWGPEQDIKSSRVMSNILDSEKPNMVVFLGDVVTANNVPVEIASHYWNEATAPTAERKIPWASVFGNHDDAPFEWDLSWFGASGIPSIIQAPKSYFRGTTRKSLMDNEENNTLSKSTGGPKLLWPSVSNFIVEVPSSRHDNSTSAILYFLDSGGGSYPQVISASQSSWFQEKSSDLNPHSQIPEIVFWHIPSKAYEQVAPKKTGGVAQPCIGSINLESVASQEAEWGIMDVLRKRTSVKAVVVGHNHGLDWCCPDGRLWLCFARHTGYGGYGDWTRGARVIEFSEDMKLASWVTLEDGSVINKFEM